MWRKAARPLWIFLALVFLFEAWLWEKLSPIVAAIVAVIPLREIKVRIAVAIERLPPAATVVVFVVPVALLLPIKFAGIWLLARGHWMMALGALASAKVVGVGITAFLFDATRDKLLQIAWFRALYDAVMRGLAWAHGLIDPVKRRVRKWLRVMRPGQAGKFLRRVMRIRRRMQHPPALAPRSPERA
jgi:hypothetical protein